MYLTTRYISYESWGLVVIHFWDFIWCSKNWNLWRCYQSAVCLFICSLVEYQKVQNLPSAGLGTAYETLDAFINSNMFSSDRGVFSCGLCDYSSSNSHNVKNHIESKHVAKSEKMMPCFICNYICHGRNALRMHMRNKHRNEEMWILRRTIY